VVFVLCLGLTVLCALLYFALVVWCLVSSCLALSCLALSCLVLQALTFTWKRTTIASTICISSPTSRSVDTEVSKSNYRPWREPCLTRSMLVELWKSFRLVVPWLSNWTRAIRPVSHCIVLYCDCVKLVVVYTVFNSCNYDNSTWGFAVWVVRCCLWAFVYHQIIHRIVGRPALLLHYYY